MCRDYNCDSSSAPSIQDICAFDSRFSSIKTLGDLFPPGSMVFMLGAPYYGCTGEVSTRSSDFIMCLSGFMVMECLTWHLHRDNEEGKKIKQSLWAREMSHWVGYLPCTRPTWVWFLSFIPYGPSGTAQPELNPEHSQIWPKEKKQVNKQMLMLFIWGIIIDTSQGNRSQSQIVLVLVWIWYQIT